jgi:hypothetical protein
VIRRRARVGAFLGVVGLVGLTLACSSGGDAGSPASTTTTTTQAALEPTATPATLEGPITNGTFVGPADTRPVDLATIGYVQEELFASGTATSYTMDDPPSGDGEWDAAPGATAPYKTRFVVRRPSDPDQFSGTVVVEWLNVSAVEASPEWTYTQSALIDAGAAWVGVSAQAFGVTGGTPLINVGDERQDTAASGGIRATSPERYGTLEHPGDQYAFDIYSQVATALRAPGPALGGIAPSQVIAAGESQSAAFLTTYINAVQPIAHAFDGFFVHSRAADAASLDGAPGFDGTSQPYRFRADLEVPVVVFETETDVGLLRYATARQDDTDRLRVWEAAGTSHADAYLVGGSFPLCPAGINDGPQHYVTEAAMAALIGWVAEGTAPPSGEPIQTDGPDGLTITRDEHGNALGGVRTPSLDVPVSTLTGEAQPGAPTICALFGGSTPFDAATLHELYPTQDDYLAAFGEALDDAIDRGFVREADRAEYEAEARAVTF